jgi:hypothetical protein
MVIKVIGKTTGSKEGIEGEFGPRHVIKILKVWSDFESNNGSIVRVLNGTDVAILPVLWSVVGLLTVLIVGVRSKERSLVAVVWFGWLVVFWFKNNEPPPERVDCEPELVAFIRS